MFSQTKKTFCENLFFLGSLPTFTNLQPRFFCFSKTSSNTNLSCTITFALLIIFIPRIVIKSDAPGPAPIKYTFPYLLFIFS